MKLLIEKPHTASELKKIINDWLAEDANWGKFEQKLARLINEEDRPVLDDDWFETAQRHGAY